MALEIERKFLVADERWREAAHASQHFAQGYLNASGKASVRVRIEDGTANLNIKAAQVGSARAEYEYAIPLDEAREILDNLSLTMPVEKTRYWVLHAGHTWEIDVFEGANAPLIVAEIELDDPEAEFEHPPWLGAEITDDVRYYNHALAFHPYNEWAANASPAMSIDIDLPSQALILRDCDGEAVERYPVATAVNGGGEFEGSNQTPRGQHIVRAKIGAGLPADTVFSARRPTGERYSPELAEAERDRDWVLARILWLSGTERGHNRLGAVDTMRRFIYIHGVPDSVPMGKPSSRGCIRMHTADVIDLFDRIPIGTRVMIHD
ncbi:L,D-transpeptidase family protein [Salinisphaera sp. SPP-AMP-43]|uniref:L,D-transpeptidase family protein n=1 Tax=Salinisphaera sp. SPP-AMP-43 TaxID=3121288 RepID=UPI003C6E6A37